MVQITASWCLPLRSYGCRNNKVFTAYIQITKNIHKHMQLHMSNTQRNSELKVAVTSTHLPDVLDALVDVGPLLGLLGVVGLDEDGGVRLQSQLHHLSAQLGQVRQPPQQVQDLGEGGHMSSGDAFWDHMSSGDAFWGHMSSGDAFWGHMSSGDAFWGHMSSGDVFWGHMRSGDAGHVLLGNAFGITGC